MDHFGNIGLLDTKLPVIASPSTIMLLKAILDTTSAKIGSNVAYYREKAPDKYDSRVLKTVRGRDKNDLGRDFVCTKDYSDSFKEFLSTSVKRGREIEEGKLCTLNEYSSNFKIKPYDVDHSLYGATAYILECDTPIAYTGDFRMHGKKAAKSKKFIEDAKSTSVLITEGTRASRGYIHESEEIVFDNCLGAVQESKDLVIADFSARNFERLESFQEIAQKVGRTIIVTKKDAYLLKALEKADGIDRMKNTLIYNELKAGTRYWESKYLKNEIGEENYIDPTKISSAPDQYLLCFSLFDMKNLLDIRPEQGTYVYSSSEAFEEESEYDFLRLTQWLETFHFSICGFEIVEKGGRETPSFIKGYHASGHVSRKDIRKVIEKIDPDVIIPIHTDNPDWFYENFDNVIKVKEGQNYPV
jgi:ribonuclease J